MECPICNGKKVVLLGPPGDKHSKMSSCLKCNGTGYICSQCGRSVIGTAFDALCKSCYTKQYREDSHSKRKAEMLGVQYKFSCCKDCYFYYKHNSILTDPTDKTFICVHPNLETEERVLKINPKTGIADNCHFLKDDIIIFRYITNKIEK